MNERERFIRTFSRLHASEEALTEVLCMIKLDNNKKMTRFAARRILTLALAAALLLALGVTAYAVGQSIHAERQAQLREQYRVEENHVSAWQEFETPEDAEPGVTLLAAYNGGGGVAVYVNVCPVKAEEVRTPFYQTLTGDGRLYYLSYIARIEGLEGFQLAMPAVRSDWEYAPEELVKEVDPNGNLLTHPTEEAQRRRWLEQAYDSESQTLTLEFHVNQTQLPADAETLKVQLISYDNYVPEGEESRFVISDEEAVHRDFGCVSVPIPASDVVEFTIPEPVCFINPTDEGELQLLGGRISATGFGWVMHFDEMKTILSKAETEDKEALRAHFERQLSWINFMDECVADAYLVFSDGSTLPFAGSSGHRWLDDERILTDGGRWEGTIDVHDVTAVCVAGQRIELP